MNKAIVLLMFIVAGVGGSQAQSKAELRKMADQVSTAFSTDRLAGLDAKQLRNGNVVLRIENSGGDIDEALYRKHTFSSFAAMGRWLRKQEIDGFPARIGWPLVGCKKGSCEFFQDGGISHNHVYLTGLKYGYRNKQFYIKRVELLAG